MQIGAEVFSADREKVGTVDQVVLDPKDKRVTHFIVEHGFLLTEDKVVPADWVDTVEKEALTLNQPQEKFDDLPNFEETHFVALDPDETRYGGSSIYFYPPLRAENRTGYYPGYPVPPIVTKTEQNLPDDVVAIGEDAKVLDSEGKQVGTIERVLFNPELNRATHFIIAEGLFFKERKLIPTLWVTQVTEDEVHLSLSVEFLDRLPEYVAA
jgi:uncharacterized protein YrrD